MYTHIISTFTHFKLFTEIMPIILNESKRVGGTRREVEHDASSGGVVDDIGTVIEVVKVVATVETPVSQYHVQLHLL